MPPDRCPAGDMSAGIGIVFPQVEGALDPGFAREYAAAAEDLGYDRLVLYEHVLGADPAYHTLSGPYTHDSPFLEPFVLFAHLAAHVTTIEFVLSVLVLPQRQTALVAKQVATLDLLSNERLTLGIGVGWNQVEYEALGQDFRTRGRRIEGQIGLLRRLWTEDIVTHEGEFDVIRHAGILPRPRRPIPVWMGGWAEPVLRRIGRLADGWLASSGSPKRAFDKGRLRSPADLPRFVEIIHAAARDAGRDPGAITLDRTITRVHADEVRPWDPEEWATRGRSWLSAGADQVTFALVDLGFSPQGHLDALSHLMAAWRA